MLQFCDIILQNPCTMCRYDQFIVSWLTVLALKLETMTFFTMYSHVICIYFSSN